MDKLPKGWKVVKFMDVCSRITDGSHCSPKTKDNGFPYVTVKDISDSGEIDSRNCKKISENDFKELIKGNCQPYNGDVLLSKDGTVGKTALVDNDEIFVVLSSLAILSPIPSIVHSKFLYLFLNSPEFQEKAISSKTGAAIKRIVLRNIKEFQIPIPPLSEQTRIVSKLDSLFSRIDKSITVLEENIKYTKALMASVLEEVFRDAENKWHFKKFKSITTKIGSGSTPRGGQDSYKTSGISLIRSMNVHDGEFRHTGLAFIDETQAEKLSNVTVEKKDVLLNITGASVARCCIVDDSSLPARVNQHVSIIRPTSELNPYFLQAFLISPHTKSKLLFNSSGGATREAITKTMIENLEVPVPDLKTQENIVNYIQKIKQANSKIILEQQSKLTYLKALKSSILDRAFKGEL